MASCSLRQPKPAIHATPSPAIILTGSWYSKSDESLSKTFFCHVMLYLFQADAITVYQTNNSLTKSFCSSATRSFLVSSATYKGCSLTIQPDRLVAVAFLHHPPASSWPAWMEALHLWDDDLCCQLSAIQVDWDWQSEFVMQQNRKAQHSQLQDVHPAMKVASFHFNPDRLASASPWHPRDKTVCIKNHDYFFSSPLLEAQQTPGLDCQQRWTYAQLGQLDVSHIPNDNVDAKPWACGDCSQQWSRYAWNASWSPLVFGSSRPRCQPFLGCRSLNMYSCWMRHFLTKASRSIRQL